MGQEIRDDSEEYHGSIAQVLVGNGGGQVGLATAVWPNQHQPAIGFLGKFIGFLKRLLHGWMGTWETGAEVLKASILESTQVGELKQLLPSLLSSFSFFALTGNRLAKIGMSIGNRGT